MDLQGLKLFTMVFIGLMIFSVQAQGVSAEQSCNELASFPPDINNPKGIALVRFLGDIDF